MDKELDLDDFLGVVKEYKEHNEQLENSPEYKKVIDDVMREVYTTYVNWRLELEKRFLENELEEIAKKLDQLKEEKVLRNDNWRTFLLSSVDTEAKRWYEGKSRLEKAAKEAQKLIKTDPEKAAQMFSMFGMCHMIWGLKKEILKEKYGMTWYTPAEVNPYTCYD